MVFQPHAEHVFHMSSALVVCYCSFFMLFVFTWLVVIHLEPYGLSFGCRNQWQCSWFPYFDTMMLTCCTAWE